MYCQNCGTQHNGNFCPNCGAPVPSSISSSKSASAVQAGKKSIIQRWWFWTAIGVFVAAIVLSLVLPEPPKKQDKQEKLEGTLSSIFGMIGDIEEPSTIGEIINEGTSAAKDALSSIDSSAVTVTEQVLLDQNGIRIILQSIDLDSWYGPTLSLYAENNTDKNVFVQTRGLSVNDAVVDAYYYSELAAGGTSNDVISITGTSLTDSYVEMIQKIEFFFTVYDSATWAEIFVSDVVTVHTNASDSYVQAFDAAGEVVVNYNGIRVIIQGLDKTDSLWGRDVKVLVENDSGKAIAVQTWDVSVNGIMIMPIYSSEVPDGKVAYGRMSFMQSDLDDNDIDSIETVVLTFHIYDPYSWDTVFDSEPIKLTFTK
jgi:preprotein translocase subunit SecG